jgi:uncharacterized sulfatase
MTGNLTTDGARLSMRSVFTALLISIGFATQFASAAERPNILWITCEDISPNLGCYGDPDAKTPHLDKLASEGVRYTHAFSVAGVCAPSRSCLITGMYPSSLGSQHMRCVARLPASIRCFTEYLRDAGYYCSNNVKEDYNFRTPKTAWDASSRQAHWRNRREGQPFFSVFNFTTTHESQIRLPDKQFAERTASLSNDERHDPARVRVPPWHPDAPEVRRDWARYHDLITAMDRQAGELLKQLEDDGLADSTIVCFFSDHGVGLPRGKRWLYDAGTRVPLIVRFPKAFERFAPGAAGTVCDRLVSFVDFAPTVLSLAGIETPAHFQGDAFLGPRAGSPRQYVFGIRDRMDERYDLTRSVRDRRYKYIRNYRPELPYAQFIEYMEEMPTMKAWRRLAAQGKLQGPAALFMQPRKPVEELYDTQSDPDEVRDLAASDEHREALERLRAAHFDWVRGTIDLGLLPEADMEARSAESSPYEWARREGAYPQARILQASLAASAEPSNTRSLVPLLADADPAVRWWAVTGLRACGASDAPALNAFRGALSDSSPSVRVAAASALARQHNDPEALVVLVEALQHDQEHIRLSAAIALDELGAGANPVRAAMAAAASDASEDVRKVLRHAFKLLHD